MALPDLLEASRAAAGPRVTPPGKLQPGGVDPLGLRQINFDLMDLVLPSLNNVGRHVRPFVVVAWAWRRVARLVEAAGRGGESSEAMQDFVDRIEAIFAWSQFLLPAPADLPGRQALGFLLARETFEFGGPVWVQRRDVRRYSTGLIAPVNYGPALKSLGWIREVPGARGVFTANPEIDPALDSFEKSMKGALAHPAFNRFGSVTVTAADARKWGELWAMDLPTAEEKEATFVRLAGPQAVEARRRGCDLIRAAAARVERPLDDIERVRALMAEGARTWGDDPRLAQTSEVWRVIQVRQTFRLALEALLYWIVGELMEGPRRTEQLAAAFVEAATDGVPEPATAAEWMTPPPRSSPVDHMAALQSALAGTAEALPRAIAAGLRFCLSEAGEQGRAFERSDRLPLSRARLEFDAWRPLSPEAFIGRVIEVWVLAQHVYWSVGRGLADARARGKTILRLRVVMDEGGWTLTPGTTRADPPNPTPDRLQTALTLLDECDRLVEAEGE